MKRTRVWVLMAVVSLIATLSLAEQQTASGQAQSNPANSSSSSVPRLVKFSGVLRDLTGKPLAGPVEVTFAIYKEQADAAPLWQEAQTLALDEQGRYTVLLGAMQAEGLPLELFASGEAHWVGIQAQGAEVQPRVLLVSVPYALKAGDAETLSGKPASDFVLAQQLKEQVQTAVAQQAKKQPDRGQQALGMVLGSGPTPQAMGEGQSSFICPSGTSGDCVTVTQSSTGRALYAVANSTAEALRVNQSGTGYGLLATSSASGVYGVSTATTGTVFGIRGESASTEGRGILGFATATTGGTIGLWGNAASTSGTGLLGDATATTGTTYGLRGRSYSSSGTGILAYAMATTGTTKGLWAEVYSAGGTAAVFQNTATSGKLLSGLAGTGTGTEVFSVAASGNLLSAGTLSGTSGSFSGGVTAASFAGNGAALTNLNGGNLTSGTVPSGVISGTYSNAVTFTNAANSFTGNGSGLTNLTAANISAGTAGINISGNAATATTAATATNALALGGLASSAYEQVVNKNAASGYAGLDTGSRIAKAQAPSTTVYTDASNTYRSSPLGTAVPQVLGAVNNSTGAGGFSSNPLDLAASAYNSASVAAETETFRWRAEPVGNNTATPAATLNLLYGQNTTPTETGLSINKQGVITFASGQAFPGGTITGSEQVTGNVTASGQLISTVATGTAPLQVTSTTLVSNLNADRLDGLHAAAFALVGAPNSFAGTQTISSGDLSVSSGDISLPQTTSASAGVINLGGSRFIHACCAASYYNTFVGSNAGNFTTTGIDNTASGYQALQADTTGSNNTASGYGALSANTEGGQNTASGAYALSSNITGLDNTASGYQALSANTGGTGNSAFGTYSLLANTSGSFNSASGYYALSSNTGGNDNTASGSWALYFNTTGSDNTASGYEALEWNTTGNSNTAVGKDALQKNCRDVPSFCTGEFNTAVGDHAGVTATYANGNVTGSNNTFIGHNSGPGTSTQLNYATAIGAYALVSASNALVLGGTGTYAVNVGIGTETPSEPLHVASGDVYASLAGSGVIVKSPDGTKCARIGIDDTGALSVTALACP